MRCRVNHRSGQQGFTLLELITVLAIIGVLATIALPDLMPMLFRTRRAEAHMMLKSIYTAQLAHYSIEGRFSDTFDPLGVMIEGGRRIDDRTIQGSYYTYTLVSIDGGRNFMATASGDIYPGDSMSDILVIRNDMTIVE